MFAHKVSRAKWEPKSYLNESEIAADAITGCLRTSGNTLSWWCCSSDPTDVAKVALALAVEANKTSFATMDIALLPAIDIENAGLEAKETPGNTIIEELQSRHVDLIHLDLERLTIIARLLARRIRNDENDKSVFRFTSAKLKGLVTTAIQEKRLDLSDLPEALRNQIVQK